MMSWHRRGDYPVDTHVLIYHSRKRRDWLDQCLASLEVEPTNILLLDHASNNVGFLRAMAMREGNAPFLSFVDDDDWVMPGAFQACLTPLEDQKLVGAYTDFSDVNAATGEITGQYVKEPWNPRNQQVRPFEVLHVHVYRRAPAMKYLDEVAKWPTLEESILMGLLVQDGDWLKVDFDGYRKRMHNYGAGSRITPQLLRKLGDRLGPILIPPRRQSIAKVATNMIQKAVDSKVGCESCRKTRADVGKSLIRKINRMTRPK